MRSWIGIGLLAAVVVGSLLFVAVGAPDGWLREEATRREPIRVSIYFGGEKSRFLRNPKVQAILTDRYGVELDAIKAGSIEMATTLDPNRVECLWPSNAVAVELARRAGREVLQDQDIFASPIVFYAWAEVADALEAKGIVRRREDGVLVADVAALAAMMEGGARWRDDLGLEIYGKVQVRSTDPAKSNSGNIWSALLATIYNGGDTPTEADLPTLLPRIVGYFEGMGYMPDSSGDIFEWFLKQGVGSQPIIVGYENQMVEFLIENESYAPLIREKIRIIYPEPTIFASHPLISMGPGCGRLIEALEDPKVQEIAWREHGFRTGISNDPAAITVVQPPEQIALVAPMPAAVVMEAIVDALR